MTGDLNSLARWIGRTNKAIPGYVHDITGAGLRSLTPETLVQNVDTRTLQSSETPFEGEPEGRGLEYGEGNTPLGSGEWEAVLEAAGPFGIVGVVNDANSPAGFPYGIVIESKTGTHARAHAALPAIMTRAAPAAWAKNWERAR